MTVYVFDREKRVRKALAPNQVTTLQHDENNHTVHAAIDSGVQIANGEHIGFKCVDGKFRLFTVDSAAHDDDSNTTDVTATDALVSELQEIIAEENQQLDVDLHTAIIALLPNMDVTPSFYTKDGQSFITADGKRFVAKNGSTAVRSAGSSGWIVRGTQPDRTEKSRAYFASAWEMLKTFEQLYQWRIVVYYEFSGGAIGNRVIETMPDEGTFRGRILHSRKDASHVYISRKGKPITRLYVLGPAQGSQDVQTNLTIADAEWSRDAGDPADKPKGQTWIEDVEAVAKYGLHTDKILINGAKDANDLIEKGWQELQRLKEPKITVEAIVADVEMLPGHSHLMIRLGDLVAIRLRDGSFVVARVIAIKRDYINPLLTKITIGDKKDAISSQVATLVADATHTFERLTIYQNRFYEDEALIQLNAEFIQANAKNIEANAEQIRLNTEELLIKADRTEIQGFVTVEDLEAEILSVVDNAYIGGILTGTDIMCNALTATASVWTEYVSAYSVTTAELIIGESALYKTSLTVVTGIDVVKNVEGHITAVQPVTTQFHYYT